jgi:hypothetical protein
MFKRMVLKRVYGDEWRLENAMEKRSVKKKALKNGE